MKKFLYSILFSISFCMVNAQMPYPALIGYWHNWNDANAPYIQLDAVDSRYNVIVVAFALPTSTTDMTMVFTPDGVNSSTLISKIQTVQAQGRKVLLSIGGSTASIDLTTSVNKNKFVSSMNALINQYGFDGIDIDIESGKSILINGGTIIAPADSAQINLINAVKEIMANYRSSKAKKLLLTITPETAYVQGGQSAFAGIWGGYLPIIQGLRDSLDMLQVQLYNSGSMKAIDGNIYTQGNADFVVSMTETVIKGFSTSGGTFAGLPARKVAVGLPACSSAAGGGFIDTVSVKSAIDYLRKKGPKPGTYSLADTAGYPDLGGMMTWSINWDAVASCGGAYTYAANYRKIFGNPPFTGKASSATIGFEVFPNPSTGKITLSVPYESAEIIVYNTLGQEVIKRNLDGKTVELILEHEGIYFIYLNAKSGTELKRLLVVK